MTDGTSPPDGPPAIDPDLPICDAHHHLWDSPTQRYLVDDFLADIRGSGHRVIRSVLVESGSFTLAASGSQAAVAEAAMGRAAAETSLVVTAGTIEAGAAIVGHVDLRLGADVAPWLDRLSTATGGRLQGIRHCGTWDADAEVRGGPAIAAPGLFADSAFRRGLGMVRDYGLVFDCWAYQTQHAEVIDLARAFADLPIVYNHTGGMLGIGPYAGRTEELYAQWYAGMAALATLPNVWMKLGGLGMKRSGFVFFGNERRPSGEELAVAWRPWIDAAIGLFGPGRCLFESNFPVDGASCSYRQLWNAFKLLAAGASADEKAALFHDTAATLYRIPAAPGRAFAAALAARPSAAT